MAHGESRNSHRNQLRELARMLIVEGCAHIRSEIGKSRTDRRGEAAKVIAGVAV